MTRSALTALLTAVLLAACGGSDEPIRSPDDAPPSKTIQPPDCAASGACR